MRTIDDCLGRPANNFDILRLFAALLVLWSHSYPLSGNGQYDIFSNALHGYDLGGSFGVAIFFVMSGFLVTRSAASRSILSYLLARCLRILPALVLCTVMTVFVIGPVLTKMTLRDYFRDPSTFAYLGNATVFDLRFNLADTTTGLPYPLTINGSLWTLWIEFSCYLGIGALFLLRAMNRHTAVFMAGAVTAAFFYCIFIADLTWQHGGINVYRGITLYPVLKNVTLFLLGGALWVYRTSIPLTHWFAAACIAALVWSVNEAYAQAVYILALPYLVIYAAIGFPQTLNMPERIGDLSYGIYLFAFPVQQTVIHFLGPWAAHPTMISVASTLIVCGLAAVSWHLVERPALALKAFRGRQAVVPSAG